MPKNVQTEFSPLSRIKNEFEKWNDTSGKYLKFNSFEFYFFCHIFSFAFNENLLKVPTFTQF